MPLVDQDHEHLRLLSIIYYIFAGMTGFFGLFGVLYLVIGLVFAINPPQANAQGDPRVVGYVFTAVGSLFLLLAAAFATVEFLAGRYLKQRRHHTFCLIVAGINCLWIPIGTALGVCTILVLQRPRVRELFNGDGQAPNAGPSQSPL